MNRYKFSSRRSPKRTKREAALTVGGALKLNAAGRAINSRDMPKTIALGARGWLTLCKGETMFITDSDLRNYYEPI